MPFKPVACPLLPVAFEMVPLLFTMVLEAVHFNSGLDIHVHILRVTTLLTTFNNG